MRKLRILFVHNFYQQSGGEDIVFAAECNLLREKGHEVIEYVEHNNRIQTMSKLNVATQTIWSKNSYRRISDLLAEEKPDIAHFHNIFPLISPSAYYACYDNNISVVQSLHNFRLICPAATLYRNGHVCKDCLGKHFAWPGIQHGCYHGSRTQTAVIVVMLSIHRLIGTWRNKVDFYVVGTEFMRQQFLQSGLPDEKIVIKPNFLAPSNIQTSDEQGNFALFVGRLVTEKGVQTLLESWKSLNIPLKIVGDGPLQDMVVSYLKDASSRSIEYLGKLGQKALQNLLRQSRFLIFPSEWYEAFPMIIVDAFMNGLPVIASRLGAAEKIITNEFSGLHFNPGDPADLAVKVQWAWDHPQKMARMGQNARQEYEQNYSPERNYQLLMEIYERAIKEKPYKYP